MTDYNALRRAVIGSIPEDRNLWRINWLKSLLDGFRKGEFVIKSDDPDSVWECIMECEAMVRDVNFTLADWPQIVAEMDSH